MHVLLLRTFEANLFFCKWSFYGDKPACLCSGVSPPHVATTVLVVLVPLCTLGGGRGCVGSSGPSGLNYISLGSFGKNRSLIFFRAHGNLKKKFPKPVQGGPCLEKKNFGGFHAHGKGWRASFTWGRGAPCNRRGVGRPPRGRR